VPGIKSFILDAPYSALYAYVKFLVQDPTWVGGVATITFYDYAVSKTTHKVVAAVTWTQTYGDLEPASVSGITLLNNPLFNGKTITSRPTPTQVDANALAQLNNAVHIYFGDQFGTIQQ
jgi:hypothetical protein